jgi:hypothetical protein
MPFTKVWTSTGTAYGTQANWQATSIRTSAYAWTASGSGTNEYYVRTSGGANPGILATPPTSNGVYINGSSATKASLGSLAAGNWGYGDNDALGYSTIYVRLSDGTDPDSKTADYVQFYQIPQATEHVRIPVGAGSISSDLDQSSVAIGDFRVEAGYSGTIGSATGYLRIDPDAFSYESIGTAYIDIGTAAISVSVLATGPGSGVGYRALNLRGSAITTAEIRGGVVGLASLAGETSTLTTLRCLDSADVVLGAGCAITTAQIYGGKLRLRCSAGVTTLTVYAGEVWLEEACAATTINQYGGTIVWNSSGTIATLNGYGGTFDESQCGTARTLTTTNVYSEGFTHVYNNEAVTHTNKPAPQKSMQASYSAI